MKSLNRIYHPWWTWECYPAGFYASEPPAGMDSQAALDAYAGFLSDLRRFDSAIGRVFAEWIHSCEQFLTNDAMNRVAWIGQSSACIAMGLPSRFRGGFKLLSPDQQRQANELAETRLSEWAEATWQQQNS
jgi:hypothetical protein